MLPLLPWRAAYHRLLRANLPPLANGGKQAEASTQRPAGPWPLSWAEIAALVPGLALAISLGASTRSVPLGMAFAMALISWAWRRAAVRYGHEVLRRVSHELRALDLRQAAGKRLALASAADTLVIAIVGLFPGAFLLQSLSLGLQAIGTSWAILLAFFTIPASIGAFAHAILGAWRGYLAVNRLTDGLLGEV